MRTIYVGKPCKGCGRTLRSCKTCLADAPGTVQHRRNGLCDTCDKALSAGRKPGASKPKPPRIPRASTKPKKRITYRGKPCAGGCGNTLRTADDRPEPRTTRHVRGGYCHNCLKTLENTPLGDQKTAEVVQGLAHLLNAREDRKAKQQRVEKALAYEYLRRIHYNKTTMKEN